MRWYRGKAITNESAQPSRSSLAAAEVRMSRIMFMHDTCIGPVMGCDVRVGREPVHDQKLLAVPQIPESLKAFASEVPSCDGSSPSSSRSWRKVFESSRMLRDPLVNVRLGRTLSRCS